MEEQEGKPSITITFHEEHVPIGLIIGALREGLRTSHEMRLVGIDNECEADDVSVVSVQLRIKPVERDGQDEASVRFDASDRLNAHCDLLDALDVPNGKKAIAIALHTHWSEAHQVRFGDPANPVTVKRWRTERSSRRSPGGKAVEAGGGRLTSARRDARRLRIRHAIRVDASGGRMRDGYRLALDELEVVNAGRHGSPGKPDTPLPSFCYETFRRDCLKIRDGSRKWPSSRRRRR
ncbi:hypothetical protein [Sphingomonas sp. CFBP 8760]|uniref:hypothetical protein n=1 Tax=Sphingomonas sp. CFBP 8760 TaxID=2775282 RepID=UPI001783242D|nr:hypothetical protein [Sphingomonas sp. CFBP 8760]MBD8548285.1 hypothetical protein [Sphingomonas sp. CFBP 8760]